MVVPAQVLLHDWWLIRADADSHGKRLGIGGFILKEGSEVKRCFSSAPIVKRQDAVTLKTDDGLTVMVLGFVNKSRTLENGFSHEMCNHFLIGFPYYWEEFADLSVSEKPADVSASKWGSCSDACNTPTTGDHGTKGNSARNGVSTPKKESSLPIQSLDSPKDERTKANKKRRRDMGRVEQVNRSGPLTRSRARLLLTKTVSDTIA